jgi:hypothetical protein
VITGQALAAVATLLAVFVIVLLGTVAQGVSGFGFAWSACRC